MDDLIGKWTPARHSRDGFESGLPSEHEVESIVLFSDRVGRTTVETLCGRKVRLFPRDALDEPTGREPSCNTCLLIARRRAD